MEQQQTDSMSPPAASTSESSGQNSSTPPVDAKPVLSLQILGAKDWATRDHTSNPTGEQLEYPTTEVRSQASLQHWDHSVMSYSPPDHIAEFDHLNGEI